MSTKLKMKEKLIISKQAREAFVRSQLRVALPLQVRALRNRRGWNQADLAREAGMVQPRISAIEQPGHGGMNLETLLKLAAAFDVALAVRFVSFSEVLSWSDTFSAETFDVPCAEKDLSAVPSVTFTGTSTDTASTIYGVWNSDAREMLSATAGEFGAGGIASRGPVMSGLNPNALRLDNVGIAKQFVN